MAGGIGTGILVTGHCFCCIFDSFEEIDVPRRPSGRQYRRPTKKAVKKIVDEARETLAKEHGRKGCEVKLTFGFTKGVSYIQDLTGIGETARWVEKIINH